MNKSQVVSVFCLSGQSEKQQHSAKISQPPSPIIAHVRYKITSGSRHVIKMGRRPIISSTVLYLVTNISASFQL